MCWIGLVNKNRMKRHLLLIQTDIENYTIFTEDPDKEINHAMQTYGSAINVMILNDKIIYVKNEL